MLIRAVEMKLVKIREMKVVEAKIVEEMKLAEIVKMSGIFVPGHKQRKGDVHPLLLLASNVASPIWHNLLSTIIYSRFDSRISCLDYLPPPSFLPYIPNYSMSLMVVQLAAHDLTSKYVQ